MCKHTCAQAACSIHMIHHEKLFGGSHWLKTWNTHMFSRNRFDGPGFLQPGKAEAQLVPIPWSGMSRGESRRSTRKGSERQWRLASEVHIKVNFNTETEMINHLIYNCWYRSTNYSSTLECHANCGCSFVFSRDIQSWGLTQTPEVAEIMQALTHPFPWC